MTKFRVTVVLTVVTDYVTYAPDLAQSDGLRPAGRKHGASAAPARGFATRSRADPGLRILLIPTDGQSLIFVR